MPSSGPLKGLFLWTTTANIAILGWCMVRGNDARGKASLVSHLRLYQGFQNSFSSVRPVNWLPEWLDGSFPSLWISNLVVRPLVSWGSALWISFGISSGRLSICAVPMMNHTVLSAFWICRRWPSRVDFSPPWSPGIGQGVQYGRARCGSLLRALWLYRAWLYHQRTPSEATSILHNQVH